MSKLTNFIVSAILVILTCTIAVSCSSSDGKSVGTNNASIKQETVIKVSPTLLNFGAFLTGKEEKGFALTNESKKDIIFPNDFKLLVLGDVSDFEIEDSCDFSKPLKAGSSCDVLIAFFPSSVGGKQAKIAANLQNEELNNAKLKFVDIDGNTIPNPSKHIVELIGQGREKPYAKIRLFRTNGNEIADYTVDFGVINENTENIQTVKITNTGTADLDIQDIHIEDNSFDKNYFGVETDSCIEPIKPAKAALSTFLHLPHLMNTKQPGINLLKLCLKATPTALIH